MNVDTTKLEICVERVNAGSDTKKVSLTDCLVDISSKEGGGRFFAVDETNIESRIMEHYAGQIKGLFGYVVRLHHGGESRLFYFETGRKDIVNISRGWENPEVVCVVEAK